MYFLISENKGADQLRGYRKADLRLCFRICRLLVFTCSGSYEILISSAVLFFLSFEAGNEDAVSEDYQEDDEIPLQVPSLVVSTEDINTDLDVELIREQGSMSCDVRKLDCKVLTRSDTKRSVQPQKIARKLKIQI